MARTTCCGDDRRSHWGLVEQSENRSCIIATTIPVHPRAPRHHHRRRTDPNIIEDLLERQMREPECE